MNNKKGNYDNYKYYRFSKINVLGGIAIASILILTVCFFSGIGTLLASVLLILMLSYLLTSIIWNWFCSKSVLEVFKESPSYGYVGDFLEQEIKIYNIKAKNGYWVIRQIQKVPSEQNYMKIEKLWREVLSNKKIINNYINKKNVGNMSILRGYDYESCPLVFEDKIVYIGKRGELSKVRMRGFVKKRGVSLLSSIQLSKSDPFGWFNVNISTEEHINEFYAIPKPRFINIKTIVESMGVIESEKARKRNNLLKGDDWAGIREARPDDSFKDIHWKTYAKKGEHWVIEKEMVVEDQKYFLLIVDNILNNKIMDTESFETMLEYVSGFLKLKKIGMFNLTHLMINNKIFEVNKDYNNIVKEIALLECIESGLHELNIETNNNLTKFNNILLITTRKLTENKNVKILHIEKRDDYYDL